VIYWDTFTTPLGELYVAINAQGICDVTFGEGKRDAFLANLDPLARLVQQPEQVKTAAAQLRAYFEDYHAGFSLPVDLSIVTPFQRRVLEVVRKIPAGQVLTYKEVAERLGKPRASRAVGNAVARNPVPIIVPCHRVVASGGGLGGYSGGRGVPDKQYLLRMEGALR
jgi:methylated-DNA-[protein]-cysteine S-methyltransferase